MPKTCKLTKLILPLALLAAVLFPAPNLLAQDEPAVDEEAVAEGGIAIELDDIVVIGTRVRGVAPENLSVPVEFYEIEEMTTTGTSDLAVALQQVAPSFNSQRNAIGDGGLFHSALLRGMTPNHTLVLVNGKRRHSLSFPRPLETALQGTTGVDLRAIPIAAIERIEVLRHGAVPQYGADAIGGVINIVLKENAEESTASLEAGVTGEGDGGRYGLSTNVGLPLGSEGALNLTLELFDQGRTDRAFETSHLDPNGPNAPAIERKVVLGEPEYDIKALFLNAAVPLAGDAGELYAFGGWSVRNGLSSGAWRDPAGPGPDGSAGSPRRVPALRGIDLRGPRGQRRVPLGNQPMELRPEPELRRQHVRFRRHRQHQRLVGRRLAAAAIGSRTHAFRHHALRPPTSSPMPARGRATAAAPSWKPGRWTRRRPQHLRLARARSTPRSAPDTSRHVSASAPATTLPTAAGPKACRP